MIAGNVDRFAWSPDETRLIVKKVSFDKDHKSTTLSFLMVRREAPDRPLELASKDVRGHALGLSIAGFGWDGRTLYFNALAKATARLDELNTPGVTQIHQLKLPE